MSQNGPYSGPPSQPWSGGESEGLYTAPSDPWSDHTRASGPSPWGAQPASTPAPEPPVDYSRPYEADAAPWAAPAPPRRRNTPIVALVAVLGLLILGGLGTTAWLLSRDDKPTDRAGQALPPTTKPTTAANVVEPQRSAQLAEKGQCVRNDGTPANPAMTIVACTSGTFEVLKRVDGRATGRADAEAKCSRVVGYTDWYFYDTELDSLDFVLCLRER
jgi:hypothetical protein